jgi:Putative transposase/Transposase zinc-binding domain
MSELNLLKRILEATRNVWDHPGTRPAVRKNFAAVLDCGTPALGWEVYASETEEKYCYHRCKSRFCPSCGYRATLLWLEQQAASLPDIRYAGIVFTMPRELWTIFKRNRHLLHDLPILGAGVIQQWVRMKYGVSVLVMVVPHTFGGDLKFNAHLHILVSAGGLSESEGRWIPSIRLHKGALMRMWRYAIIDHLRRAAKANVLKSDLGTQKLQRTLTTAYEKHPSWIIFLDQITSKSHFLRYAARYVRRPPIASWRLLGVTDQEVEFVAKDTKAKRLVPTRCEIAEFVRRLAPHVQDKYRHAIRYFGLLAPRTRGQTQAALFALLGQRRPPRPQRLSWRESLRKYFGVDPLIDSHGQTMRLVRRGRLLLGKAFRQLSFPLPPPYQRSYDPLRSRAYRVVLANISLTENAHKDSS